MNSKSLIPDGGAALGGASLLDDDWISYHCNYINSNNPWQIPPSDTDLQKSGYTPSTLAISTRSSSAVR